MKTTKRNFLFALIWGALTTVSVGLQAAELKLNEPAPVFKLQTHQNTEFDLASRRGKWTVLFFYPKASTPGCTKQACAFRDSIGKIRALNAEVYGISSDTVQAQAEFHREQRLNFSLLADVGGKVAGLYGSKLPLVDRSKRWTFIIGPELKIRHIMKDVDPVLDAGRVAEALTDLQKTSPAP